jgi:hypothetical protein
MKDFKIDGVLQRVFVLAESDQRVVYIPVKALSRVDYTRLIDIESKNPSAMLETMKKTTLDNGKNALVLYENLLQVLVKDGAATNVKTGHRLRKPVEKSTGERKADMAKSRESQLLVEAAPKAAVQINEGVVINGDGSVRKKPGPKPKSQQTPKIISPIE